MSGKSESGGKIDLNLLAILACPACRAKVVELEGSLQCVNTTCRRRYAVVNGLPVMLTDESEVLSPEDFAPLDLADPSNGAQK